ncbi:MAG TPA: hypothetical protein VFK13_14640 [Gemmatimonadaceae bacterium]|nr:hypothetical protein [Gemmatimonadaceae bacterium]
MSTEAGRRHGGRVAQRSGAVARGVQSLKATWSPRRTWSSCGAAVLAAFATATLTACATSGTSRVSGVCERSTVVQHVVLVVDSVSPRAGPELVPLQGDRVNLTLTLLPDRDPLHHCPDVSGPAAWSGELPDVLRTGAGDSAQAAWRIEGDAVAMNLNPGVFDNNLLITLPLSGEVGHWGLSTFVGEVVGGRVLVGG